MKREFGGVMIHSDSKFLISQKKLSFRLWRKLSPFRMGLVFEESFLRTKDIYISLRYDSLFCEN
jgi:hypothetical protein